MAVFKIVYSDFSSIYYSSGSCSLNPNMIGNLSLLLLWFVSAQQAPLPVPANHSQTRPGISLCSLPYTVSARQGPLPGQLALCRHRTVTPGPGLVNPESFMEASPSTWAIHEVHGQKLVVYQIVIMVKILES